MNNTVNQRLKYFIKSKKISQSQFEKLIGLANGYVNNIQESISPSKLSLILEKFPELNLEWLLIGKGEMEKYAINQQNIHSPNGKNEVLYGISTETISELEVAKVKIAFLEEKLKDKEEIIGLLKSKK